MILGRIFEVLFLQKFLQKFLRLRKFLVKSENHSVHTRVILRKDWPIRGDHPGRAVQVRRAVQVLKAEGSCAADRQRVGPLFEWYIELRASGELLENAC